MPQGFDPTSVEHVPDPRRPETAQPAEIEASETPLAADRRTRAELESEQGGFLEEPVGAAALPGDVQTDSTETERARPEEKDQVTLAVEKILEDGLGVYLKDWPEEAQTQFRHTGLEVTHKIANAVRTLQATAKDIILLIRDWLQTIPKVNKYFLEQEAKIKTDRILELEKTYREDLQKTG